MTQLGLSDSSNWLTSHMQSCVEEHQGQSLLFPSFHRPESISSPESGSEIMQIDSTRLTTAEWLRRITQRFWIYCGEAGHAIATCPTHPPRPVESVIKHSMRKMKPLATVVMLTAGDVSIPFHALLDSGLAGNFISAVLFRQLKLKTAFTDTANFYRRFIKHYSSIAHHLIDLKGKPKSLSWSPLATEAFQKLKEAFISAPLLVHTDPERLFVVEVDASTTRVGAVLSQQHPCASFTRKLSPAEINYDIGKPGTPPHQAGP